MPLTVQQSRGRPEATGTQELPSLAPCVSSRLKAGELGSWPFRTTCFFGWERLKMMRREWILRIWGNHLDGQGSAVGPLPLIDIAISRLFLLISIGLKDQKGFSLAFMAWWFGGVLWVSKILAAGKIWDGWMASCGFWVHAIWVIIPIDSRFGDWPKIGSNLLGFAVWRSIQKNRLACLPCACPISAHRTKRCAYFFRRVHTTPDFVGLDLFWYPLVI